MDNFFFLGGSHGFQGESRGGPVLANMSREGGGL